MNQSVAKIKIYVRITKKMTFTKIKTIIIKEQVSKKQIEWKKLNFL